MPPKAQRLSRRDFTYFFTKGRRIHTKHLTLVYSKNDTFRASVVVSKKVARRAVMRHRLKRRLYHLLRACIGARTGIYIVITKQGAADLSHRVLEDECCALVAKTHSSE